MNLIVVDSSAFGPVLFSDEQGDLIAGFEEMVGSGDCLVPDHWGVEVVNQLIVGLRRGRTTDDLAQASLRMIADLPLAIDGQTDEQLRQSFSLAVEFGLSIYDAAYLELAIRKEASLVTFDKRLRTAASSIGITLLP
jgi:predicted nucleic acid-binding protein